MFFIRIGSYAKKYALQAEGNKVKSSDLCDLIPISSITNHVDLALIHLQQCNSVTLQHCNSATVQQCNRV
jgi:hypothetical protein